MKNVIKIKVVGKNIERFIRKLTNQKIDLLDIQYRKYDEVLLKIYAKDYEKIEKIKTIYQISIVDTYGFIKLKKIIHYYKILLACIVLGTCLLLFLTNVITEVEVIHSDKSIRNLLKDEVGEYGIKKYRLKKSYKKVEQIKKEVLNKNKEKIEWLEIINIGTKYEIKVEERKINEPKKEQEKVNIVAKKSAIIRRIEAKRGVVTKEINSYVSAGDTIISGEIYLNEELKNIVSANGVVYGEVWYKSSVEFPYLYYETNYTGKKKSVYSIKFLNWSLDLFNFHPFKQSKKKEKVLLKHPFLPFRLVKETQEEIIIKDKIYTVEEARTEARNLAKKKMEEQLGKNESIITTKDLKVSTKESKIRLDVFFTVYENITDYKKINEEKIKIEIEETKKE